MALLWVKGSDVDLEVEDYVARENAGSGLHVEGENASDEEPERPWFERPVGIVALLVVAGLIVGFLVYRFGWD